MVVCRSYIILIIKIKKIAEARCTAFNDRVSRLIIVFALKVKMVKQSFCNKMLFPERYDQIHVRGGMRGHFVHLRVKM